MKVMSRRLGRQAATVLIMLAAVGLGLGGPAASAKKSPKVNVKLKVTTTSQAALLKAGKLKVKVRANRRAKLRLKVVAQGKAGLIRGRAARATRKARTVRLKLTARGRRVLSRCGAKQVRVIARYRSRGKKAKRAAKRRLARDGRRCGTPPKPVEVPVGEHPERCDFLDLRVCLQPFPNDYYTVADPSAPTGKRLALDIESMPRNLRGQSFNPTEINRSDGFSPGNLITLKIPGLETPAAFAKTGIVPIDDMRQYARADQPVLVIDAETGERQPIWAELDSNPTSVNPTYDDDENLIDAGGINKNPGNVEDVNLIIRPARNFEYGHRYIVALRNLKDGDGKAIEAPLGFQVYRDGLPTEQKVVEDRRPHMGSVIDTLTQKAGVDRSDLYMAWDFTVASSESLTGRALEIRDNAFARLGDDRLDDLTVAGDSPDFTVDQVLDYTAAQNGYIRRQVRGRLTGVPCYLNQDGCPPGSSFEYGPDGKLKWNPAFTTEVPFRCNIPRSVVAGGSVVELRPGLYGHGLLGSLSQVNSQDSIAFEHQMMFCATDWAGFSSDDAPVVATALVNLTNFSKLTDRMQQGFVNFMMLGRAMIHHQGFSTSPAFQIDPDDETLEGGGNGPAPASPVIDTDHLYYEGKSQGGIMGGALTALAPDFERSVLNVPGMNYSTLLQRSVDFDEYAEMPDLGLYPNYPDQGERQLIFALMQLVWDRGEPNGYGRHMTDDPLPDTPPHRILYQVDVGDHQVANVTAEVAARTVGASVLQPALDRDRHWDVDPFLGLPPIPALPYDGSALVYWDGGPVGHVNPAGADGCDESEPCQGTAVAPDENVPPRPEWGFGGDPHSYSRDTAVARQQASDFMRPDGFVAACAGGKPCYANGWTGAP